MDHSSRQQAVDDARDDFVNQNWPTLVTTLERNYGSLRGRLEAVVDAAREHTQVFEYGPHLHLLQVPNLAFGLTDLPAGHGWWMPDEHAIVLDRRLTRRQRRSVLAHLLVHVEQGDPTCRATWMHEPPIKYRCSGAAQAVAALRLVDFLRLASSIHADVPFPVIARNFGVAEEVIHTRLDTLSARQRQLLALLLEGDELRTHHTDDTARPGHPQGPLFVRQRGGVA